MVLKLGVAVEEADPLDGEGEGLSDIELEGIGSGAVKGGSGAERGLLACDTDLVPTQVGTSQMHSINQEANTYGSHTGTSRIRCRDESQSGWLSYQAP
jgi:hypothetical protein